MSKATHQIAGLALQTGKPTRLTFAQLHEWVIWQFPRHKGPGMCGAVHPPVAGAGWYPAIVDAARKRADVYGHLEEPFSTPEAAADWLATS